jgi:SP family sugar:H+ symporter-like MFS transporter
VNAVTSSNDSKPIFHEDVDSIEYTGKVANSTLYVLFISAVAAIGGFLFGFDSGVINGTVGALEKSFAITGLGTGFSVASVLLGCAVGALLAGPLSDRYGRKPLMLITAVLFAISSIGSGAANDITEFIIFRLVGGLGIGGASVLVPAYIAEVAPASLRGRLATLQQLAIVTGLFIAFLSNYALALVSGGAQEILWLDLPAWRWMFWMELIPSVMYLIGAMTIPESPRYLVAKGEVGRAKEIFKRITPGTETAQVNDVQRSLQGEAKPRLSDLLIAGSKRIHPIVWIGIALSVFQQFVGINVVFYYGAELWQAAGYDESQSLFINLIGGTTNVVATFVAIALIDRIGRKPLLLIGSIGMTVTLGALTWIFSTAGLNAEGSLALTTDNGTLALIAANVYVFFFGMSWGPVVWVLLGEMFNNRIRAAALAVAASVQWLANFLVTMTFPALLTGIGLGGAYSIYASAAFISIFFVMRFIKETRGRRLEEM